jgi:cytochrome b
MGTASSPVLPAARESAVQVWDPLVRIFHWTLALAFFVAYFSGEGALTLHA